MYVPYCPRFRARTVSKVAAWKSSGWKPGARLQLYNEQSSSAPSSASTWSQNTIDFVNP